MLNLAAIGLPGLLGELFGEILVPPRVAAEFMSLCQREPARFGAISGLPVHARVLSVAREHVLTVSLDPGLDDGEIEALALAVELRAALILVDERIARRTAARLGLRTLGVLGVLLLAKARGRIPVVAPWIDRLQHDAGFWIGASLRARVLCEAGEG